MKMIKGNEAQNSGDVAVESPRPAQDSREQVPLCPTHRQIDNAGHLEVFYGNACVACSLSERAELLKMLEPFADGTRASTEVLYSVFARLQEVVCSNCCPSTWKTGTPQPHRVECGQLQAALAGTLQGGREIKTMVIKEQRCADCWRVIERDKPHTCKQQVKANQKAGRKPQ